MPQNVYSKLYPSGSCQDKFYGTAKMHKLSTNRGNDFPLHPIISNIEQQHTDYKTFSQIIFTIRYF